jgi:Ni,Fe-hydrogenase III large subunit
VPVSRAVHAKQVTGEVLDQVRSRFFELAEYADSLDLDKQSRLLSRWEEEVAAYSEALIGQSLAVGLSESRM